MKIKHFVSNDPLLAHLKAPDSADTQQQST